MKAQNNFPRIDTEILINQESKQNLHKIYQPEVIIANQPNKKGFRFWKYGIVTLTVFGFLIIYSIFLANVVQALPSPERLQSLQNPATTEFYDRNGKLLYRLYEGRNRSMIKVSELPEYVVDATIAVEDKHFYSHHGIDLFGIARSFYVFFKERQIQGGSTITQQLIKNTLLSNERTIERKTKEIILSLWAETIFSKDEILQMYFNEAPYGGPAWGIEAASQTYFAKSAKDLTLSEAAYLAGLPASPTVYSWYGTNPELGEKRRLLVLKRMLEEEFITLKEYTSAENEKPNFASVPNSIEAPHFVMWLRQQLASRYGEKTVSQGGLKIYTSLDLELQKKAEGIVAEEVAKLANLRVSNGAAMVTDAKTGQVLAMVGSKDYFGGENGNYNVTTALRQPGSSIKPITYVTGFKQGYGPGNILLDNPVTFKNAWETYSPVNYDGKFHGPVTIRQALGSSYNIPAVKMMALVGVDSMVSTAKDLGITTFNDLSRFGLSLTLGGGEVRMVDMMSVYGTFATGGIRNTISGVTKVVDPNGIVLEESKDGMGVRVLTTGQAYMVNNILSDNNARIPAFGPNSLLNISGYTVAVKTGTTDQKRDNWTFGYTPDYVVGIWVGNNDNSPMDPLLSSGVTGAAPIWNRIMKELLKTTANKPFTRPSDVAEVIVDGKKDLGIVGIKPKSAIAIRKKEGALNEKEVTYTDPFSARALTPSHR